MTMPPGVRKLALTTHVVSSIGWIGAVAGFLVLAIAGLSSSDLRTVRGVYIAMDLITWYVILPLAFASLLTGILQALGTAWGLFQHYWVLVKLLVTILATVVLLLQTGSISLMADAAAQATLTTDNLRGNRSSLVLHSGVGLLVLLVPAAMSVYKPRGRTRYGHRKQHEQRQSAASGPAEPA